MVLSSAAQLTGCRIIPNDDLTASCSLLLLWKWFLKIKDGEEAFGPAPPVRVRNADYN